MKYDFFISYSQKDTAVVDEFVNRFQREGFHFGLTAMAWRVAMLSKGLS